MSQNKFLDNLRDMVFWPWYANFDLRVMYQGDQYEYIAVIVDDILIFSKNP